MPLLVTPNTFTNNVSTVDAATMNANFAQIVTILNAIDNANVGTLGFYASQIKPTSAANATFGAGQNYVFPQSLTVAGGVANAGYLTTTATGMGLYTASGVPTFSAPNATMYLRYDGPGTGTVIYVNTSGASTSGTTWTTVAANAVYSVLQAAIISYTATGAETNAAPGTMATVTFAALPTSPLTQWRIIVESIFSIGTTALLSSAAPFGIGTATAGTSPFAMFSLNPNATTITGGNVRSDALTGTTGAFPDTIGDPNIVKYSALFANGATPSFTALLGANALTPKLNGMLTALAIPV